MRQLFMFAMAALTVLVPAHAADLNTPLNDKPTLGSEIHRGLWAANACYFIHDNEFHPDSFDGCIISRDSANTQSVPSYKPFSLGLHFQAWFWYDTGITIAAKTPGNRFNSDISKRSGVYAPLDFEIFRKLQRDLGVSDAQLIQIAGIPSAGVKETYQRIGYWARKTGH